MAVKFNFMKSESMGVEFNYRGKDVYEEIGLHLAFSYRHASVMGKHCTKFTVKPNHNK